MNIDNIVLVRVTNVIPVDGMIIPVSETKYIEKNKNGAFASEITSLLKRAGLIITPIDFTKLNDKRNIFNQDMLRIFEFINKVTNAICYEKKVNKMN